MLRKPNFLCQVLLIVLIPKAQLFMRRVEVEAVAFAAALNAAFVRVRALAPAVLQLTGEPLQVKPVTAGAGLPCVCCGAAVLQVSYIQTLRKDIKY